MKRVILTGALLGAAAAASASGDQLANYDAFWAQQKDGADAMLKLLAGPSGEAVLKARGMERPPS